MAARVLKNFGVLRADRCIKTVLSEVSSGEAKSKAKSASEQATSEYEAAEAVRE
jgi:hypothetical protein